MVKQAHRGLRRQIAETTYLIESMRTRAQTRLGLQGESSYRQPDGNCQQLGLRQSLLPGSLALRVRSEEKTEN